MNYIANSIKYLIYYLFYKSIILQIIINKKFCKKKIFYNDDFGFGDFIVFCVTIRFLLKKNQGKIYCYSMLQYEIASFFFEKENIQSSLIKLPFFLSETYLGSNFLSKSKYFEPYTITKINPKTGYGLSVRPSTNIKKFILNRLRRYKPNNPIKSLVKKKYLCLFVKHYHSNNNLILPSVRQTANLHKIKLVINFLLKKNINIILLGKKNDIFLKKIKKLSSSKIFILNNYSKNYSFFDQLYIASNSEGYIGSATGVSIPFYFFKKKILIFDTYFMENDRYAKNINFLYKKVLIKKKFITLTRNYLETNKNIRLILEENSSEIIIKNIKKVFKNLFIK
jgi:hypothetical protein